MSSRAGIVVSSLGLSLSTVASKILGVVRDMMVGAVLGAGPLAGVWQMALLAPNMFRRIFGEGAVGTAMVPMLADEVVKPEGRPQAALQLRVIMLTIAGILLFVTALGILVPTLIGFMFDQETSMKSWLLIATIPVSMPYVVFICLAGVATAALNVTKNFFWPGMASLFFNITTIALLGWYQWSGAHWNSGFLLVMMCLSVVFSGILQLAVIIHLLKREKLLAPMTYRNLPWRSTLSQFWRLGFPAIIGASVLQISMLIDWALAWWLVASHPEGEYAVGALSYAEHVGFLPISAIALSLGVVGLSHMTVSYASGNLKEMKSTLNFGLRYVLFLSIPMAVFTGLYAHEIVSVIYERGNFAACDVAETAWALQFLAIGIPVFCLAKVTVAGFQSRKDMKTPVKVAAATTVINLACALALMWTLRQGGLAVALVVSSLIYNVVLLILLQRDIGSYGFLRVLRTALMSVLCAGLALGAVYLLWPHLPAPALFHGLSSSFVPLIVSGILFCGIYGVLSLLFRMEEMEPFVRRFRNRFGRKAS